MNKKNIISASDGVVHKFKVLAKKKENTRHKLVVTAKKLAVIAKSKESVRGKLAMTAKKKEGIRKNLAVTAERLAITAKEKEEIRKKLVVTAEKLAVTAKEKEVEEMKNDFISFVSHQLRTPLTVIKWNAEMLGSKDAGKLTPDQKRYLTEIDRGEQRMAFLISSLLNISRLESGRLKIDPKPTDLVLFISTIVSEGEPYASAKNCAIIFKKPKKEFSSVKLDQLLMREIISNLIGNATRYSKTGKCETEVSLEQKEDFYQINVVDQGIGIPIDVQDKIFTKFFRAENAVKFETEGTGLGLYITKLIIEAAGGKIWFESAEGKGSAFHFTIPKSGMREVKGEKELSV